MSSHELAAVEAARFRHAAKAFSGVWNRWEAVDCGHQWICSGGRAGVGDGLHSAGRRRDANWDCRNLSLG